MVIEDPKEEKPVIAQLEVNRSITSMRKYIEFHNNNYLRHVYF